MEFGCGQCLPCRVNRRRLWTHRIMLEAAKHRFNSFCTLTYDEKNVPLDGSVDPKETSEFIRRLRRRYDAAIRYFVVGEYGETTGRPHYHPILFGFPPCSGDLRTRGTEYCACGSCSLLRAAWTKGFAHSGELTYESAAYVAGYVTKKMTSPDDPRLNGRKPEFARMSLKPGIGAGVVTDIAKLLSDRVGAAEIAKMGDVPTSLRYQGREWPLGRYLRRKLREELGFDEIGGQASADLKSHIELLSLCESAGSVKAALEAKENTRLVKVARLERRAVVFRKLEKL